MPSTRSLISLSRRRRRGAFSLAASVALTFAGAARGDGPDRSGIEVYFAAREPSGGVSLRVWRDEAETLVESPLQGAEWRPWGLRRTAAPRVWSCAVEDVEDIDGALPRLRLGCSGVQLIAFRGALEPSSGIAALGDSGVSILAASSDDRWRLANDGAVLALDEQHLGLVLRGSEEAKREDVAVVDLDRSPPRLRAVGVPAEVVEVEPESAAVTSHALYFAGRLGSGEWSLFRAPLAEAEGAEGTVLTSEEVAGPFERLGPHLASGAEAVAFLALHGGEDDDVYVAGPDGPAVNVTRSPGRYVEHRPGAPRLAISDDGAWVAYNLEVSGEPELFVHRPEEPGPAGRAHITRDAQFNPYIDQETWILFDAGGKLLFAAGHDPVTTDLFRWSPPAVGAPPTGGAVINLTRTGSGLEPPFLTKGSLAVQNLALHPEGTLLLSAAGFPAAAGERALGVDSTSGAALPGPQDVLEAAGFFRLGDEVLFLASRPDGARSVLRLSQTAVAEVGSTSAPGAPRLLALRPELAVLALPGAGTMTLEAGGEPAPLSADLPNGDVALGGEGRLLAFEPAPSGEAREAVVLDVALRSEVLRLRAPPAGDVVALRALEPRFLRGDATGDGGLDISDPVRSLLYLFAGAAAPPCLDAADADDNGAVEVTDAVVTLDYLFRGGRALPAPFPAPGADPTPDRLDCAEC